MVVLPTRYYVQQLQSDSTYGPPRGWETVMVTFDRDEANVHAESFELAAVFEEGENISELIPAVARVVTEDELRAEGEDALASAEMQTRIQLWQKLAEWAAPLTQPDS
jgi:hypothetical protein